MNLILSKNKEQVHDTSAPTKTNHSTKFVTNVPAHLLICVQFYPRKIYFNTWERNHFYNINYLFTTQKENQHTQPQNYQQTQIPRNFFSSSTWKHCSRRICFITGSTEDSSTWRYCNLSRTGISRIRTLVPEKAENSLRRKEITHAKLERHILISVMNFKSIGT